MTTRTPSLVSALALLLSACAANAVDISEGPPGTPAPMTPGPAPSEPGPVAPAPTDACGAAPATSISGVVGFPNGTLPVAKAIVYVPVDPGGDVPRSGACGECIDRGGVYAITETATDGSFQLTGVPADTTMVVIQKGPFIRRVPVALTPCAPNPLAPDQARLPRDASEGQVPRIAVVTGTFDHMQSVLGRLGLSPSAYDTVAGDGSGDWPDAASRLFSDRAALTSYDYVFVNCGAELAEAWEYDSPLSQAPVRENIRAFVEGGGRLYVTDLAYDVVEVTLPSAMDFGSGSGLSETPEPMDAAASGNEVSGSLAADVLDEDLRAWLGHNGALDAAGQMQLRGLSDGFVVIQEVSAEHAKPWVQANVSWGGGYPGPTGSGVRPMTVTADRGCGRALFTSYHTVEEGGASGVLSPQEQSLAYLVLEIGNCIEEPTLY